MVVCLILLEMVKSLIMATVCILGFGGPVSMADPLCTSVLVYRALKNYNIQLKNYNIQLKLNSIYQNRLQIRLFFFLISC